ncbi:MAG: SAM-dependent methyltransferase [Alphaproteobacteria bacterium CG_4_10_14_0_8_um_filter_53_9]|nr:MAG: SAM-dependent methyltransferase [Alphaproteobacteria bacterium CG_4_10_14_0_8_um_filter_53_9]
MTPLILATNLKDYALLDSGNGRKLEKFGPHVVDRPEPQAMWPTHLPQSDWDKAVAIFTGQGDDDEGAGARWQFKGAQPAPWPMEYGKTKFLARFTPFRHMGFFADQTPHWDFMLEQLKRQKQPGTEQPKLLNVFGYTGVASLIAAQAGAHVTHVDASKKAIGFARESQELAGLSDKPIRWIVDDALKFVEREARRGNLYDGILLDPPKFGRGPDGQKWEVFEHLPALLAATKEILNPKGGFLILNAYAIRSSFITLHDLTTLTFPKSTLHESGELVTPEKFRPLRIPTAIFTRLVL